MFIKIRELIINEEEVGTGGRNHRREMSKEEEEGEAQTQ